jgi:hypothetical protein
MKSVKLIFTLALLVCLVSMTALAAGVDNKNTASSQTGGIDRAKLESDATVRMGGQSRTYDMSLASPEVRAIEASALSKYSNVSAAGLSGTYTIPGDFADLPSAAAVLNFVGLGGNVVFELASTSYTSGTVSIGGTYPGAGTYSVTIRPAAATAVVYNFISTSTNGKGFAFSGAKNVTIDGLNTGGASLTLGWASGFPFPSGDAFGSTIYITNVSNGISVLNTHVKGNFDTPVWAAQTEARSCVFIFTGPSDAAASSNLTFDGDTFTDGSVGIKGFNDWNAGANTYENVTVNNCKFGGAFGNPLIHGMWLEIGYNPVITNNTFDGLSFLVTYWDNYSTEYMEDNVFALGGEGNQNTWYNLGQTSAFHLLLAHGGVVANNVIKNVTSDAYAGSGAGTAYGTRTYGYNLGYGGDYNVKLYNNRFSNIFFNNGHAAISVIRGPGINVYHNSVRLTGTFTIGTPSSSCMNGVTTAYNNAFSNELTGGSATGTVGVTAGGTIDYNAIYSTARYVSGFASANLAVAGGVNTHGVFGPVGFASDLHITAGASSAKEIGKSHVLLANDIDAAPRDTTDAGKRDAGADEFSPLGSYAAADVFPGGILTPPAGVPVGPPQIPTVSVKNNSQNAATFSVSLTSTSGYSDTKSVSLLSGEIKTVIFAPWSPAAPGAATFTATTLLGGDAVPGNDVVTKVVTASAPVVPPATYTFNASSEGWTGTIDWIRSNSFTKLGGVNGGSGYSWVTVRGGASTVGDKSTYTEGAYASSQGYATTYPGANFLTSPWLDISGFAGTDLYISFQHSIETEPAWDRSWIQYTVDGTTWNDLGVIDDANGINWYNTSLYKYAALWPDNFDEATATLYGLGSGPPASWTSNDNGTIAAYGDGVPRGPSGYVYAQLKVTETSHPALVGASAVRFRYVAFSDAVGSFGGWAFDNFGLSATPPVFTGGTINGHAFQDLNGNGTDDGAGEPDYASTKVYVSLFGSVIDSVVTNGTGDYTWSGVTLPAGYGITLNVTGVAFTVPYGLSNSATVNHPSTGGTLTQNFGTFVGGIAGKKFSDLNDNGVNDLEPGLAGWTIEVHKDSATGLLMGSKVTDVAGAYSVLLPPGTFVATEVAQAGVGRQTAPVGGKHTVVVNSITPLHTAKDFGNFIYARMRVSLTVDGNGNGTKDPADIIAVPSGASSSFIVRKGVDTVGAPFTLGSGTIAAQFNGLDLGVYTVTEIDSIPGWRRTKGGVHTFTVNASGQVDTAVYLDFKYLVISGTKYNDLNGNGAKDGGEPGLAGWTINVSGGNYYGATSAVTDVNGDYSIDSVFTGTHTVTEVALPGWTQTSAAIAPISGISGNLVTTTGKNFGNFDLSDISGLVYRDYNGNGVKDPEDVVMPGVTITLVEKALADVTDGSGYSFTGVLTTDSVAITVPGGFVVTQPASGGYRAAILSGGAALNQNFGLFQTADSSTKYRTFTADQMSGDGEKKPGAKPKAGKAYDPVKNKPSTANLVDALINPKTGFFPNAIVVGLSGQLNDGGKTKAYVVPNKQGAFWASLNNKGVKHTGMARGFDVDVKGKPFLKLQKAFAPGKKQNNKLFAELLALKLNLLASGVSTPAGLGVLIYNDPSSSFDGWTIDEIADYADTVMTNFEFMPLGIYTALDTIAGKINGAFYFNATDDTANGWASPVLTWKAYKSVFEVSFLKPNPGATPKNRRVAETEAVPTAFALSQNYPNPFNPTTTIEFDVPQTSIVTLKVYNLLGQEVATLLNKEEVEFSETLEFDASSLPSGVYLYRIVAETVADAEAGVASETFTQVKKMVLVK